MMIMMMEAAFSLSFHHTSQHNHPGNTTGAALLEGEHVIVV